MAIFEVTFKIPASMQVDCDDETDAMEYVQSIPVEEFQKLAIRTNLLNDDNIEVLDIKKL